MTEPTAQLTDLQAIQSRDLGTVTLGRTTYTVTEQFYVDGRYPASTYLTGPRGATYYLRPYLGADTGLRQVVSMGSGNVKRDSRTQAEVRVLHLGDHIELAQPRPQVRYCYGYQATGTCEHGNAGAHTTNLADFD